MSHCPSFLSTSPPSSNLQAGIATDMVGHILTDKKELSFREDLPLTLTSLHKGRYWAQPGLVLASRLCSSASHQNLLVASSQSRGHSNHRQVRKFRQSPSKCPQKFWSMMSLHNVGMFLQLPRLPRAVIHLDLHWTSAIRDAIPDQFCSFFLTLFKRGVGGQTHVQKNCCKFVMAFWYKIDIKLI